MLTADEVADLLRKSVKTIYRWANEGLIPSIDLHGNVLFDLDEILAWIEDHRMAA
jgi:excisionase family DNA binding protein